MYVEEKRDLKIFSEVPRFTSSPQLRLAPRYCTTNLSPRRTYSLRTRLTELSHRLICASRGFATSRCTLLFPPPRILLPP